MCKRYPLLADRLIVSGNLVVTVPLVLTPLVSSLSGRQY